MSRLGFTWLLLLALLTFGLTGCEASRSSKQAEGAADQAAVSQFEGTEDLGEQEEVIFSFITASQKKMILSYSKETDQMIYRFFNKEMLEIQLPTEAEEAWQFFLFQDFHRAGNDGDKMDINQVVFSTGAYRYEVYDNYNTSKNARQVGIRVISIQDNATYLIEGDAQSAVGSLMFLYESFPKLRHEELYQ